MSKVPRVVSILFVSLISLVVSAELVFGQTATYTVQDIAPNTIGDSNVSYFPKKINDSGVITGFKSSSTVAAKTWTGTFELPAGDNNSVAYGIANSGIVVGRGLFGSFDNRAYVYNPTAQSFFWLPCPLYSQFGRFCEAYAANNNGIVVGTSDPRFLYPQGPDASSKALKWDNGTLFEIFPSSTDISVANDINASNVIAGMRNYQPFILSPTTGLRVLGNVSNTGTETVFATAINDDNHVVGGHLTNSEGLAQRAFFWDGTTASDIGTLGILQIPPGQSRPVVGANDINNNDQVVGDAAVGFDQNGLLITHAFIWDPDNGMRDLNSLIPSDSGIVLTQATGINNSGDIAAVGYRIGDNPYIQRGYFLEAPEIVRPPLIFIPGTMGSELYLKSDREKYWIRTFSGSILGYNNYLTLDPTSEYFLGDDAFSAKDALRTVNLAGYDLLAIYRPMIDRLKNDADYIEYDLRSSLWALPTPDEGGCDRSQINTFDPSRNPTLFVFPYDFRFDNARSAEKLAAFVRCVQEFHPNKPINLLGHSQGGLIARRYIIDHPNDHGVGKLITVATPFLGAPEAIYKLESGGVRTGIGWGALWEKGRNLPFSLGAITPNQIKFLAKHFKSVHQLMPSREYNNLSGLFGIKEIGDVNGDGVSDDYYDYDQMVAFLDNDFSTLPGSVGKSFHDCLPANLSRCQDDWRQDVTGIEYMHLVGQQSRDTTTIYLEVKNETVLIPNYPHSGYYVRKVFEPIKGSGDGTVPEISASRDNRAGTNLNAPNTRRVTLASLDENIDAEYEHNGLTQNDQVFQYVLFGLGLRSDPDSGGGGGGDTLTAVSRKNTLPSDRKSEVKTSEVTTSMSNGDSLQPTQNESYYTKIIGISDVQVSDDFGNTTVQEGDVFVNNIAGLDYSVIGEDALFLSFPVSITHFATFQAGGLPFSLEVVKGVNNRIPNLAIRFKDVSLPTGTRVQLIVTSLNEINLKYDSNGDGSYDSVIQPTASVAGSAAADRVPPTASINVVQEGSSATLTISATDTQSGLNRIMYSVDGQTFQVYDAPVSLQYSSTPFTIYAIADDNVANRSGLYSKTFTFAPINVLAVVRHGFTLNGNGRIEGSIQQLLGENTTMNSSSMITGDLLVPGVPSLIQNGSSTFGGTITGTGSALPSNYSITLNGSSNLGHLKTRTDATPMPPITSPPAPPGTRNVTINNSTQSIGDFATLRNLTLNSNAGTRAIPPGTYGNFTANGSSGLVLGTEGDTQPAIYNLASLTLNSNSQLQIAGPVILTFGSGVTLNGYGSMGLSSNPSWLQVRVASGGFTLNSDRIFYGSVVAPSGTITINGNSRIVGSVMADRLTINSNGALQVVTQ